jgi:probable HAF family extracellular repeat protein
VAELGRQVSYLDGSLGLGVARGVLRQEGLKLLVLATALAGLSCGGGDVTNPPTTGSLTITTNTSGPEPDADGYAVVINEGAETPIPASGTLQRDNVEPGNHSIRLTGMAANCTVAGENPRSVAVPAGETVTVTFELTCSATTGSLQITSATSGASPDADGYTMTVDGVDRGTLVASGALTLNGLLPGNHSVGLSGVAGNCQVQGDNPRSLTIVAGASVTAAFEVVCTAPPSVTGTLKITTATGGPDQDSDGYSFAIDAGATQSIGLNTSATVANVAAGSRKVRLSGVAANCKVGGTNPRAVTVAAGATAEVSFAITCTATTGSIEVTTTTKGAKPDPDGYTVRVDQGNPQTIGISATVAVPTLSPGSHKVALAGMATNCRVDGENARAVTVTAGQKATTTFFVLCPTFAAYRATDLGTLGGLQSYANDINSAGQVVGGSGTGIGSPDEDFAFLWEKGVMISLGSLEGFSSVANAINPAGQVVGWSGNDHAFLWDKGVMTDLGPGEANDINAAGQVVGQGQIEGTTWHAVIWKNGVKTDLGTLGGRMSWALGIDPVGRVVGWAHTVKKGPHAFLWENGVMTDLNIPGDFSAANAINAAGQIAGEVLVGTADHRVVEHGFLWHNGAITDLGEVAHVNDINSAAQVVGTRYDKDVGMMAFVWEDGVMTDLGEGDAHAINDDGQVVGQAPVQGSSGWHAMLWTPQ